MSDPIQVEPREQLGSRNSQRLRAVGRIPAVLYGHGEGTVSLSLQQDELRKALRQGGKLVTLQGSENGQALLQDMQWDTFGRNILHIDLLRVSAGDLIRVEVPVELRGEASGAREGGVVEQTVRSVEIEVAPGALPDRLYLDVTELHLGDSMTAAQISDFPEGAKLLIDDQTMIVHCIRSAEEPDEVAIAAEPGEPEVVGKKSADEEETNNS